MNRTYGKPRILARHTGLDPVSRIDRLSGEYWMPDQVRHDGKENDFELK